MQKYVTVGEFYLLSFKGVDDDDVYQNMMTYTCHSAECTVSELSLLSFTGVDDDDVYHMMMVYIRI